MAKLLLAPVLCLALFVGPLSVLASADPGTPTSGMIILEKTTKLKKSGGIQGRADYINDLGGGVTATSTGGMQWGANPFGEDVSGLTRSSTNVVIDTVHTHGALVQHGNADASNCYEGDIRWTPDIKNNWTTLADSGWGPFFSGFHDCWVMATGHFYIYNSVRTDVTGPDVIKRF